MKKIISLRLHNEIRKVCKDIAQKARQRQDELKEIFGTAPFQPERQEAHLEYLGKDKLIELTNDYALLHSFQVFEYKNGHLLPIFQDSFGGIDKIGPRQENTFQWKTAEELGVTKPHRLQSISKSITSLVLGLAISMSGRSPHDLLNSTLMDIFEAPSILDELDLTEDQRNHIITNLSTITLKQVLTMTTGLEWSAENSKTMYTSPHPLWVQALLNPQVPNGQNKFHYADGNTNILYKVIEKLSGQDPETLTKDFLEALGIPREEVQIDTDSHGVMGCSGAFHLSPENLAKIGAFILSDHHILGHNLSQWVQTATNIHLNFSNPETVRADASSWNDGYGYQWWTNLITTTTKTTQVIAANGIGGQKLFIVPQHNLIVTTNGSFYTAKGDTKKPLYQQSLRLLKEVLAPLT